mmetsp:Transcript_2180/g.4290  ORF Transcript_2180/g.4290 Transcript_2180/m.4290 type:complete len:103 (-) Transcript_2180:692-1000(-)
MLVGLFASVKLVVENEETPDGLGTTKLVTLAINLSDRASSFLTKFTNKHGAIEEYSTNYTLVVLGYGKSSSRIGRHEGGRKRPATLGFHQPRTKMRERDGSR